MYIEKERKKITEIPSSQEPCASTYLWQPCIVALLLQSVNKDKHIYSFVINLTAAWWSFILAAISVCPNVCLRVNGPGHWWHAPVSHTCTNIRNSTILSVLRAYIVFIVSVADLPAFLVSKLGFEQLQGISGKCIKSLCHSVHIGFLQRGEHLGIKHEIWFKDWKYICQAVLNWKPCHVAVLYLWVKVQPMTARFPPTVPWLSQHK